MRRNSTFFAVCMLLFMACNKQADNNNANNDNDEKIESVTKRNCDAMQVLETQIQADPSIKERMDQIERFTDRIVASGEINRLVNGVIEIPVVVNVLYRTAAENVSAAQIQSQIDVLNEDYNGTNSDFNAVPALFSGVKATIGVRFVLDQVIRKQTNKVSWKTNDAMKKSAQGGIDATSPTTKLNLWVCTLSGGVLGYAQFPGGAAATDGVVILNTGFGRVGTARAPFNLGRTATHEIGHWMNLRHIWGDTNCGNDFVDDTPLHNTANYGCPAYPTKSTCTGTPVMMTMNYMDYTDDGCMYMFSVGQKTRMLAVFVPGGPHAAFAQ